MLGSALLAAMLLLSTTLKAQLAKLIRARVGVNLSRSERELRVSKYANSLTAVDADAVSFSGETARNRLET